MDIKEKTGIAIGGASMCWSETPKGVFDSTKAKELCTALTDEILVYGKQEYERGIKDAAAIFEDESCSDHETGGLCVSGRIYGLIPKAPDTEDGNSMDNSINTVFGKKYLSKRIAETEKE